MIIDVPSDRSSDWRAFLEEVSAPDIEKGMRVDVRMILADTKDGKPHYILDYELLEPVEKPARKPRKTRH